MRERPKQASYAEKHTTRVSGIKSTNSSNANNKISNSNNANNKISNNNKPRRIVSAEGAKRDDANAGKMKCYISLDDVPDELPTHINNSNKNKFTNDNDDNYWNQYQPSPKRIINNTNHNAYNDDNDDNEIEEDDNINYNNDSLNNYDDDGDNDYEYEYKQDNIRNTNKNTSVNGNGNAKVFRPMQENYYPSPNEMKTNYNTNAKHINTNYNDGYKRAISPVQIRQSTPTTNTNNNNNNNAKVVPNRNLKPPALPYQQQQQQQQEYQHKQQQQQQQQQYQHQHRQFQHVQHANQKSNHDRDDDEWSDVDDEIPVYISPRDSSDLRYGDELSHRGPREGYGQQYTKSPNKPVKKIEKKPNTNNAPALPCEAMTPKEKLYFSKEPREVEYKPYTLSQYKLIKPKEYVEITPHLKPDLNTDVLRAKRANLERIKEFSRNLKQYNKQALDQQKKLPNSEEVNDIEIAKRKMESNRERMLAFAKNNIPKPKIVVSDNNKSIDSKNNQKQNYNHYDDIEDDKDDVFDDGFMTRDDNKYGKGDNARMSKIMELEAQHKAKQMQIAAVKKSLGLAPVGY